MDYLPELSYQAISQYSKSQKICEFVKITISEDDIPEGAVMATPIIINNTTVDIDSNDLAELGIDTIDTDLSYGNYPAFGANGIISPVGSVYNPSSPSYEPVETDEMDSSDDDAATVIFENDREDLPIEGATMLPLPNRRMYRSLFHGSVNRRVRVQNHLLDQVPALLHSFRIQMLRSAIDMVMEDVLHMTYPYTIRVSDDDKLEILCRHPFRLNHQTSNLFNNSMEVGIAIEKVLLEAAKQFKARLLYKCNSSNMTLIKYE